MTGRSQPSKSTERRVAGFPRAIPLAYDSGLVCRSGCHVVRAAGPDLSVCERASRTAQTGAARLSGSSV